MRQRGNWKKRIAGLLVGFVFSLTMQGTYAYAAQETYTVTYRPGNVGCFALSDTESHDKQEMAQEVAELLYGGNQDIQEIAVTQNGAIKLVVKHGATIPTAPGAAYIKANEGYFVKNISEWGADEAAVVEKNVDFVVDYGKLVNGVEYTVQYVDVQSNTSVAPVAVAYGNVGDTIEVTAPEKITLSGVANYLLTSAGTEKLVLSEDSSQNVVTFTYEAEPTGIAVEEIIEYEEGDTVEITQTILIENPMQQTPGAVIADGQEEQQPGNQQPENPEAEDDTVEIPNDQVPLDDGEVLEQEQQEDSNVSDEIVVIEDEAAVLSDAVKKGTGMYWGVAGALAALAVVSVIWYGCTHRAKVVKEEETEK